MAEWHTAAAASARGGARSSILAQTTVQLGSIGATMIIARILVPAEFGIIALTQSFIGAASLIGLAGITAAIVTTKADVHRKASTYFWAALILGGLMAAAIAAASPLLVSGLGQPNASPYVMVLALTVPISLVTLVPQALLQRRLQFTRMNAVTVIGALVYFGLEIVLALLGWGAWAVIWAQVVGAVTSLMAGLALARWLPTTRPRISEVREDFGLIGSMGLNSVFGYVGKNADYWVTSAALGPAQLGIYYVAYVLPSIVRVRLSGIFRQVMLPIITRLAEGPEQTKVWRQATMSSFALALPAMFGIAAVSGPLVVVFFGQQWASASIPMQLVTLAGVTDLTIHAVTTMAIARKQLVFRSTLLVGLRAVLIAIGSLIAALTFSTLTAVAAAVLAASLLTLLAQELLVAKPLGIGVRILGWNIVRILSVCILMFLGVQLVLNTLLNELIPILQLITAVGLGILVYASAGLLIARSAVRESVSQLGRLIRGR